MKIYVASSWRNLDQPDVVRCLRELGHEVYDFKDPATCFNWKEIAPHYETWSPREYREALGSPFAIAGYQSDMDAMRACDACVLVLPSGRSASFELGWCMGAGKRGIVYMPKACEPELMYREAEIVVTLDELLVVLKA